MLAFPILFSFMNFKFLTISNCNLPSPARNFLLRCRRHIRRTCRCFRRHGGMAQKWIRRLRHWRLPQRVRLWGVRGAPPSRHRLWSRHKVFSTTLAIRFLKISADKQQWHVECPSFPFKIFIQLPCGFLNDGSGLFREFGIQKGLQAVFHSFGMQFLRPVAEAKPIAESTEQQFPARGLVALNRYFTFHNVVAYI